MRSVSYRFHSEAMSSWYRTTDYFKTWSWSIDAYSWWKQLTQSERNDYRAAYCMGGEL